MQTLQAPSVPTATGEAMLRSAAGPHRTSSRPAGTKCDVARHRNPLNPRVQGILSFLGLVIAACVEGEFSEEFACLLVNNTDFYSVDEHDDAGVFVVSADSDVVHFACVAE